MANTYDIGDLVRVSATFSQGGTATDPSTVTARYRDPSGTTTTLVYGADEALTRDSEGVYHTDVDANRAGIWWYRFESTGSGQAATEGAFRVRASMFV